MTTPSSNSPFARFKAFFHERYCRQQSPNSQTKAFDTSLLLTDVLVQICCVVCLLLVVALVRLALPQSKEASTSVGTSNGQQEQGAAANGAASSDTRLESQIVLSSSHAGMGKGAGVASRSAGTLIRVRSLNVVEAFESSPIFVQVVDRGLGDSSLGAILLGDATPNSGVGRMMMRFHTLKTKGDTGRAIGLQGVGLSLDGSLGVLAEKKEGVVLRSALGASASGISGLGGSSGGQGGLKDILFKALLSGLSSELGNDVDIERQRAGTWILQGETEFFVQLTATFPQN